MDKIGQPNYDATHPRFFLIAIYFFSMFLATGVGMRDRSIKVRLFINEPLCLGINIALTDDQAKYLFKVLRLNIGQVITVLDGITGEYHAEIVKKEPNTGIIQIKEKNSDLKKPPDLWLFFSPLGKNRTEWVIEKATELGVRRIIPVITSRTVKKNLKMSRLRTIMIEALEQCRGTYLPDLSDPISLSQCLSLWPSNRTLIFCDESLLRREDKIAFKKWQKENSFAILIGPEGGFTNCEKQSIRENNSTVSISLGPQILRADTAAVAAISILQYINATV